MDINVRPAQPQDMASVLELINELAIFEKEPDAVIIDEQDLIRDGFGEHPAFHCFVAEADGDIQGMALIYFRYSTWKGKTVHLEDLIVREAYRGKGIGSALYTEVIQFATDQGVKRTEWVVLNWNKPAANFYRNSGADVLEDWDTVQMHEPAMHAYLKNKGRL
ncbi:GNAT family N-acetyltransferase [Christiangramia flava]|uniref:Histone acetyltransferase HPA2 and related acetyltransferases n=1 Tax=Christiangramia flava JLT2011 TaxID=1229726 RepID=A0A1L7I5L1_9FLAO|nr:GNAT family N-acetyltransferase [Christiangramia flava]APU68405.1 Histone acetyltransferase HPA2 and related acetyltransferases [Christiangramia flava JLT2011]OSS40807.1 Histone acetyltransferase HPA2 [Christiangramia flava JLT2011]